MPLQMRVRPLLDPATSSSTSSSSPQHQHRDLIDCPRQPVAQLVGHELDAPISAVQLTANGKYCLTGGHDRTVRLWNPTRLDPAAPPPRPPPTQYPTRGEDHHDGNNDAEPHDIISLDQLPHSLAIQTYHEGITHPVAALDTDGEKTLVTACDKILIVHDLVTAKILRRYPHHHSQRINAVTVGPFQETYLAASYDATVSIWDARSNNTRTPIQILADARDSVSDMHVDSVTPHILRTCSVDGVVRTYDVRQGILTCDQLGNGHLSLVSMAQSPDGTCLALHGLEDATIRLLDAPSGKLVNSLNGYHRAGNYALRSAFINDTLLVTGSEQGTATIYNTVTSQPVASLETHSTTTTTLSSQLPQAPICAVDAVPGVVVTGGYDGHAIVWGDDHTMGWQDNGPPSRRRTNQRSINPPPPMSMLTLLTISCLALICIPCQSFILQPTATRMSLLHHGNQFVGPRIDLSRDTTILATSERASVDSSSIAIAQIDETLSWISQSFNHAIQQIDIDATLVAEIALVVAVGVLTSKAKQYLILDVMRIDDPERMGRISLLDKFVDLIIFFLACIFVLDALDIGGLSMESLFAAGGIGALTFSLASKSLAEQVVGGLVIAAWDVFQEGDDIVLLEMGIAGTVKKIGLADTAILNGDNVLVKVPNSQIFNQHVSNLSRVQITPVRQTLRFKYSDLDKIPTLIKDIKQGILNKCGNTMVVTDGSKPFRVNLNEFKADHVEVSVLVHLQAPPGSDKYFENKQNVLEAIAAAAKHNKMDFAIPAVSYITDGVTNIPPLEDLK